MNIKLRIHFICCLLFLIFLYTNLYADFIDYYPNISPLKNYAENFKKYLGNAKKRIFIIRSRDIFSSSEEILRYTQKNYINISIIPLKTLIKLDIDNNLTPLIKKAFNLSSSASSDYSMMIPLRIELSKYGLFFFSVLPGSKYFLFTSMNHLVSSKVSLAVNNQFLIKRFKKIYPNTLLFNDSIFNLSKLFQTGIFNSAVISSVDYYVAGLNLKYAYNFNLGREKYCIIANLNYWNKQSEAIKNLIWSFITKYDKIFLLDIKKLQDKILNNIKIKPVY